MIPEDIIDIDLVVEDKSETSNTYKLSDTNIQGFINELHALQQAIYKELDTEKYQYEIYSFNYGIELEDLIGQDIVFVKVELKRRITECLLKYDEIESVDNFIFTVQGDEMVCTFKVNSIYGNLTITKELNN